MLPVGLAITYRSNPIVRAIVLSDWRETIFERNCVRKSLLPVGKFDIKIVRCHGFDHGIAQKLEPFIVDLPSVG